MTVNDSNNCVVTQGIVIDQPSEIVINSTTTDVSCFGYSNGNTQLNISGGVPPYIQNWSGFNPNNLPSGTYSYIVIDSTGCSKNGQITINQPNILSVSSTVNSVTCYNGSNGSVGLNIRRYTQYLIGMGLTLYLSLEPIATPSLILIIVHSLIQFIWSYTGFQLLTMQHVMDITMDM